MTTVLDQLIEAIKRDAAYYAKCAAGNAAALAIIGDIYNRAFPASLSTYWTRSTTGVVHGMNDEAVTVSTMYIGLRPLAGPPPDEQPEESAVFRRNQAGVIAKTEQLLKANGYSTSMTRSVNGSTVREKLPENDEQVVDVDIWATPASGPSLNITFAGVVPAKKEDGSQVCRIEYERIEVPATVQYRAKVVCDDVNDTAQIDEASPIDV